MNQLEQAIINSANVKLAGIAKGMLYSALGGATSGGLTGAGIGSLLGGTIGAVKNYRNSAGTLGNRLKAGLIGGLKGGTKGGLIGGGIGAGLGSSGALLQDELCARVDALNALTQIGRMRQYGDAHFKYLTPNSRKLISYLEGLNSNGNNYEHKHLLDSVFNIAPSSNRLVTFRLGSDLDTLKRDALTKARELYYGISPYANFSSGRDGLKALLDNLYKLPGSVSRALRMM